MARLWKAVVGTVVNRGAMIMMTGLPIVAVVEDSATAQEALLAAIVNQSDPEVAGDMAIEDPTIETEIEDTAAVTTVENDSMKVMGTTILANEGTSFIATLGLLGGFSLFQHLSIFSSLPFSRVRFAVISRTTT